MTCTDPRLTSTYLAMCQTEGWSVRGCCVPARLNSGLYTAVPAPNTSSQATGGNPGGIDGQQGWTVKDNFVSSITYGFFDQEVKDLGGDDGLVWRVSNGRGSGSFGAQPYSYPSCKVAGESGSQLWNDRGPVGSTPVYSLTSPNATTNEFYWRVDFRSATGTAQPGLRIELSASAKQHLWRMTFLELNDTGSGFQLREAVNNQTTGFDVLPGQGSVIASGLSYSDTHTIETRIKFVDGITEVDGVFVGNDIVQVFLNGTVIHTSTTFEALYYTTTISGIQHPRKQAVNSLMVRVPAPAVTANLGYGLYFSNVVVST